MKRLIRILVPESPWCANAAAWSALAVLAADAALLLLRVGASVWRKVETWRLLHGLEPVVDPGFAGEPPYAVATVSFSVVSSATLFAVALLGARVRVRVSISLSKGRGRKEGYGLEFFATNNDYR